ncbi:hypothetical protein MtrunA17_Chr8g0382551 [Medicago truncatula]|uniref:DUF630 family protein n=1 Tax=Medicago truncatula TaxID=3880 RepID=A0A396GS15_MEDTR|nr:hypothetical protein MtrunA17_Chr8g0382551 [Medicago truncatula]
MGASSSKADKNEALCLCKERKSFIEVAIDSRYDLAASHVSYIQSLRNVGIGLRRYAEAEVLVESSLSISDKTPSQTSYPSPSSPLNNVAENEVSDSPLHNESPFSTPVSTVSYMRSSGNGCVTVTLDAFGNKHVDDESNLFSPPPPPPPPPDLGASWDFFDPGEDSESFRFVVHGSEFKDCRDQWLQTGSDDPSVVSSGVEGCKQLDDGKVRQLEAPGGTVGGDINLDVVEKGDVGKSSSKKEEKNMVEKNVCTEREDPSEFITHRAKDFLSSIKDIEHRFIRASESGRDVSRLLEANKIKVGFSDAKGKSSKLALITAIQPVCCRRKTSPVFQEPVQKIISWKRTASFRSSSSRIPLASKSREDIDDSGSNFVEEFCMIAGSHSSTLDRLYAWERKLYDEVKASESIRKVYDRKCHQLRHQFAKDQGTQVIDKTRAVN